MSDHPNKPIRDAIDSALARGWTLRQAGPRAHIWGMLFCPHHEREGCRVAVYCTPRVPEDHARRIRRAVDACPHLEVAPVGEVVRKRAWPSMNSH